jgi:hypothetical protein
MALEALSIEDKVGTMLPCNVVVQDLVAGRPTALLGENAFPNGDKAVGVRW